MSTSARRAPGRRPSRAIHPGEHQHRPRLAETEPRSTRWRSTGVPGLGPASSPTSSHPGSRRATAKVGRRPERGVVERAHPVVGVRQQHQPAARGTTHQAGVEHRAAAATRHGPTCSHKTYLSENASPGRSYGNAQWACDHDPGTPSGRAFGAFAYWDSPSCWVGGVSVRRRTAKRRLTARHHRDHAVNSPDDHGDTGPIVGPQRCPLHEMLTSDHPHLEDLLEGWG